MNLINSTTYNGKTYAGSDINGIYPLKEFGLDSKFYGGNAVGIAKTTEAGIFLVIDESIKPIDIMVDESKIKEKEPEINVKEPEIEEKEPKIEEKVNKTVTKKK